jgi:hypothetical protein
MKKASADRVRAAFVSIPDVPSAFTATATSTSQIQLSWVASLGRVVFRDLAQSQS